MSPHSEADGLVQGDHGGPVPLNFDRSHQPCLLPWRTPLLPPKHGWLGQGQVSAVVPVPRGDHLPLRAARFSSLVRLTGGIATPSRRYHGKMLIRPSLPACATRPLGARAHAGSGPSRVRRRLSWTRLEVPISLAIHYFCGRHL